MIRLSITALAIVALLLTSGCSRNLFSIHRIDIEQGNILEPEAIAELEKGMTREQVVALLGHPVMTPALNPERWEYVYYRKLPDKPAEQKTIVIRFDQGRVATIEKQI